MTPPPASTYYESTAALETRRREGAARRHRVGRSQTIHRQLQAPANAPDWPAGTGASGP